MSLYNILYIYMLMCLDTYVICTVFFTLIMISDIPATAEWVKPLRSPKLFLVVI